MRHYTSIEDWIPGKKKYDPDTVRRLSYQVVYAGPVGRIGDADGVHVYVRPSVAVWRGQGSGRKVEDDAWGATLAIGGGVHFPLNDSWALEIDGDFMDLDGPLEEKSVLLNNAWTGTLRAVYSF